MSKNELCDTSGSRTLPGTSLVSVPDENGEVAVETAELRSPGHVFWHCITGDSTSCLVTAVVKVTLNVTSHQLF